MKSYLLLFLFLSNSLFSQTIVDICATVDQPPFSAGDKGFLIVDIVNALNNIQDKYSFNLSLLAANRNRELLNSGQLDILAMVNINWGYNKEVVDKSIDIIYVEDKYITLKSISQSQDYFNKIGKERTVVVNGFDYKFLNYEKDRKILEEKYNTTIVKDEISVIHMVLSNRGKIGVCSTTTLEYFKLIDPVNFNRLSISQSSDSRFFRHFVIHNHSPINVRDFNDLIFKLKSQGTLDKILKKYGLDKYQP